MERAWYTLEADATLAKLKSERRGLTATDAARRLLQWGANMMPREKADGGLRVLLRQFLNILTAILIAAAGISFSLGDILDGYVILAAVAINVSVGFVQEMKASRGLAKLRSVMTFQALVFRDGEEQMIPCEEVVPGDVLVLMAGSRIPADARVIAAAALEANESTLTGESFPVPKKIEALEGSVPLAERNNMVYAGCMVAQGSGMAAVTATGISTEFGRIAQSLKTTDDSTTPLHRRLARLGGSIGGVLLAVCFGMFLFGIALGKPVIEMLPISVAVAVAAIPEGLPVAVTVILAVGMQRLLARKALVRQLVAAETLGSTTVICTDKTGTLTEGVMSVVHIATEEHDVRYERNAMRLFQQNASASSAFHILEIGMLCNDAIIENEEKPLECRVVAGNPTDRALVSAAHTAGLERRLLEQRFPRLASLPFDSERKYMATLHRMEHGGRTVFWKGAVEKILDQCATLDHEEKAIPLSAEKRAAIINTAARMSNEGLRVLAFAVSRRVAETVDPFAPQAEASFLGMVCMKDPLRPSAREAIQLCRSAGIRVVMITGDHPLTAYAVAKELGLPVQPKNIMNGAELATLEDYDLERRIREIDVFARVVPEDKIRIVKAWQATGAVVAMTGDGINDAPALKAANIGVAPGSGTDIAKETADLVLLDDDFHTVVAAVREGRVIFDNIRKVLLYLMAGSMAEVIIIGAGLTVGLSVPGFPLPLLAAQILWVNIVTDILPNIALAFDPEEPGIMQEPPRKSAEALLLRWHWALIAIVSVSTGLIAFALFWYFWELTGNVALARSVAFMSHAACSLTYIFSIRSLRHSVLRSNPFSNPWLVLAVCGAFGLQFVALYAAPVQSVLRTEGLQAGAWVAIGVSVVIILCVIELIKALWLIPRQKKA